MIKKDEIKTIPPRYIYSYDRYIGIAKPTLQQENHRFRFSSTDYINEIVTSVANGLDIKNVDPRLYSIVINSLEVKRDEFLFGSSKNMSAAKNLSTSIDQIHRYFTKKEKEIERARKNKEQIEEAQRQNSKSFTRDELKKAVIIMLKYEDSKDDAMLINKIDPDMHSFLIDELKALKEESLLKKDFKMAEKYENSMRTVTLLKYENKYSQIASSHATELQQKFEDAIQKYKKLRLSWQQKINSLNNKIDEQIKQIQNETEQMLIEFDKQFLVMPANSKGNHYSNIPAQSETKNDSAASNEKSVKNKSRISQVNSNFESDNDDPISSKFKPSPKLLDLRKSEKSLAMSKRFKEATQLKRENDKLEAYEKSQFVSRYNNELEKRRKDLIKSQQDIIDLTYQKGQEKLSIVRKQMNEQLNQAELVLRHLEDNVNEANKVASFSYKSNQNKLSLPEEASFRSSFPNSNDQKCCDFNNSNDNNQHNINSCSSVSNKGSNVNFGNDDKNLKFRIQTPKSPKRNLSISRCKSLPHLEENKGDKKITRYYSLEMRPLQTPRLVQAIHARRYPPCKTARDKPKNIVSQPSNSQLEHNLFYKRRMINSIIYSKSSKSPNLSKPTPVTTK